MSVCQYSDFNIYYQVYGEGFPLVLSHNFATDLEIWRPQIEALRSKYQVIVYDARGHGLSTAPAGEENYGLDKFVEDLHHLVMHLGLKKAYIGGMSMGGATSLGYASRYPETVKALIVADAHCGFQPVDTKLQGLFARAHEQGNRIALERGMADLARHQIATGGAFRPVLEDRELQEWHIRNMARCPVNGYIGTGKALPWNTSQREAADNLQLPALIVVGGDDIFTLTGARLLHQHIRGSRYVEICGCVHATAQWKPVQFTQSVLDFLQAVEQGKSPAGEMVLN
jgi:pimeloyl-ACP methyl ester carboxylesterase